MTTSTSKKPRTRKRVAKPKAAAVSAEPMTEPAIERSDGWELIHPNLLHPHPANPEHRIDPKSITELADSIKQFGQSEVVRVRPVKSIGSDDGGPIVGFQILSGHRRWAACRMLNRSVRCEVVDCDDAQALREVMLGNASREDLNAIERAELMQTMIESGIDRAEAGQLFGLGSDSGVKNTLRLLQLPPSMRALIADGTVPARAARYLVPFAAATRALDKLAADIAKDGDTCWELRQLKSDPNDFQPLTYNGKHPDVRPVDGKTKYRLDWQYKRLPRKFKLTDEMRSQLEIIELPLGKDGKMIEVAQNVELFDKLNAEFLVKEPIYGMGGSTQRKPANESDAAAAKRKAKEAKEQLEKRLAIWVIRFKLWCLAKQTPVGHPAIATTLPWWMSQLTHGGANHMGRDQLIDAAIATLGGETTKGAEDSILIGAIACSGDCKLTATSANTLRPGDVVLDRIWRMMVWPQIREWPCGESHPISEYHDVTTELPRRVAFDLRFFRENEELELMLQFADVSITGGWGDLADEPGLLIELLNLHSAEQLKDLAKQFNLRVDRVCVGKKTQVVEAIAALHTADSFLPLPAVLASKPAKKGRKR